MGDFGLYDDYDPDRPATLEEDSPARRRQRRRGGGAGQVYNAAAFLFFALAGAVLVLTAFLVLDPGRAAALIPAEWRGGAAAVAPPLPTTQPADDASAAELTPGAQAAAPEGTSLVAGSVEGEAVATAGPAGTATPTTTPTRTPRPSPTPRVGVVASDVTETPKVYPFAPVAAPAYQANTGPDGCDYLAIAGQVFDENGRSLLMVPVIAEGDAFFSALDFSGNAPRYGTAGYEIFINDRPYEDTFTVRLVSETGVALSEAVEVRTSSQCSQNVVIVDFRATAPLDD